MKITYDKEADAVYIAISERKEVVRTEGDWPIHMDFSKNDKLIGIEIMQASQMIDIDQLKKSKFLRIDKEKINETKR